MTYSINIDGTINTLSSFDVRTIDEIKSELEELRKKQQALYEKSEKHTLSQEVVIVNNDLSIIKRGIKKSGMTIKKIIAYNALIDDLIEKIKETQLDSTKNRNIFSDIERFQKHLIENIKTRYPKEYKMEKVSSEDFSNYNLYKYEIQTIDLTKKDNYKPNVIGRKSERNLLGNKAKQEQDAIKNDIELNNNELSAIGIQTLEKGDSYALKGTKFQVTGNTRYRSMSEWDDMGDSYNPGLDTDFNDH